MYNLLVYSPHHYYWRRELKEKHPRLQREVTTLDLMLEIYCQHKHNLKGSICSECEELQAYAHERLEKCPYQERKTTCAKCHTHCYKKNMRVRMREVMAFAGPRMVWRHPGYALLHMWDGLKRPILKKESN